MHWMLSKKNQTRIVTTGAVTSTTVEVMLQLILLPTLIDDTSRINPARKIYIMKNM